MYAKNWLHGKRTASCRPVSTAKVCASCKGAKLGCRSRGQLVSCYLFLSCAFAQSVMGGTIFVDDDAPNDPGPGNPLVSDMLEDGSATHPFDSLQEAITTAVSGQDEVVVLAGTYTGSGNVNVDFLGKAITVRSQEGPTQTVVDAQNAPDTRGFVLHTNETFTSILDGFTITNGNRINADPALGRGGGVYCDFANPTIRNCHFILNTATQGGGLAMVGAELTFIRCRFEQNTSTGDGGGLFNQDGHFKMFNSTLVGNQAGGSGGAMYNFSCSFGDGPGPKIVNGLLLDNTAKAGGGAIASIEACPTLIVQTTLVGNSAAAGGAVFHGDLTQVVVTDSILWNNAPDAIDGSEGFHDALVRFSDVQGGKEGDGNVDVDPQFVDALGGNYRLSAASPLINAASPSVYFGDEADLDGDGVTSEPLPLDLDDAPRVVGGRPDMGAYEFPFGTPIPATSVWGVIALALSVLIAGSIALRGQSLGRGATPAL